MFMENLIEMPEYTYNKQEDPTYYCWLEDMLNLDEGYTTRNINMELYVPVLVICGHWPLRSTPALCHEW